MPFEARTPMDADSMTRVPNDDEVAHTPRSRAGGRLLMIRLALLAVVPIAPLLHYGFGLPPIWVFQDPLDLFAIAGTAFIVNAITGDGETTSVRGRAADRRLRCPGHRVFPRLMAASLSREHPGRNPAAILVFKAINEAVG
jgi:hypothetical protein